MDYKSILEELRAGRSARSLAESGLASRNTIKNIVEAVGPLGWLAPHVPLPDIKVIRELLAKEPPVPVRASLVEPFRAKVEAWSGKGFTAKQIHSRLSRETRDYNDGQRFEGSVGAVKRFLARLRRKTPEAFVVIQYDPGKTAQVDFGTGPVLPHPKTGRPM